MAIADIPMAKVVNRRDLRAALVEQESVSDVTFLPSSTSVSVDDEGHTWFSYGAERYLMLPSAFDRLGHLMGIPVSYMEKVPSQLIVPHINYWLDSRSADGDMHTLGLNSEGLVNFFYKGDRIPVPSTVAMDIVEEKLGTDVTYSHVSVNPDFIRFSATSPTSEREVGVGDPVRFGVTVTNSTTFKTALEVSAYVHRLTCSNGMVSQQNTVKYQSKPDDGQEDWLAMAVEQAIQAASDEFDRLESMSQIDLNGHVPDYLNQMFAEFKVPRSMRSGITEEVITTGPRTLYDLFNIVTDFASNSEDALSSVHLANRLNTSASLIASHLDVCDNCGRANLGDAISAD